MVGRASVPGQSALGLQMALLTLRKTKATCPSENRNIELTSIPRRTSISKFMVELVDGFLSKISTDVESTSIRCFGSDWSSLQLASGIPGRTRFQISFTISHFLKVLNQSNRHEHLRTLDLITRMLSLLL